MASMTQEKTLAHIRQALLNNESVIGRFKTDTARFARMNYEEADTLVEIINLELNQK